MNEHRSALSRKELADLLLEKTPHGTMTFALIADSHLSDSRDHTCESIRYLDEHLHYRCMVHLGDILCGNVPDLVSRRLLRDELSAYRAAIKNRNLLVVQGNHDGFCDENYRDGVYPQHDIAIDETWYEATCFMDRDCNVQRCGNKPYFYVEFPDERLRMIALSTCWYELDRDQRVYRKHYGIDEKQLCWLAGTALKMPEKEWNVLVLSHCPALDTGYAGYDSVVHHGGSEAISLLNTFRDGGSVLIGEEQLKQVFEPCGHHVLAWCCGYWHGDMVQEQNGITFIGEPSVLCNVPRTIDHPLGWVSFPQPRIEQTCTEDAWDTVVWDREQQILHFIRFGAGENRKVSYK